MADERKILAQLKGWTLDPLTFMREVIGVENPSQQQREGIEAYRRILVAKLKRQHHQPMTAQENSDANRIGIACHSGHGTGKTAWASWCLLHFMTCLSYCKIPCVAPVSTQLQTNLWPEVHLWLRKSPILGELIKWQAEKIFFKESQGREWFAVPRTVNVKASAEEQAETLAGIHADHMLVMVDEASGVPDSVFRPLEGGLTGPVNFVILIGNPTQGHGYFYDAFTKARQDWIVLHWNAEESELVQQAQIDRMARKYGRDSNAYRIRVKGLPPLSSPDTLIPWDWVMGAVDKDLAVESTSPLVLGIDVARELGGDDSVILRRQGPIVRGPIATYNGVNTQELGYWVLKHIQETEASCAAIDVIGWGAGCYDLVKDLATIPVLPVNVTESAEDPERFCRLRDQLWWTMRERFQAGTISIPNDDALIGELTTIKYNFSKSAKERIKIESKQELRDRGLSSPNKADALCLSEYALRFVGPRVRSVRPRPARSSAWVG